MRTLSLIYAVWLAAGCGVARESLGELSQAGKGGGKRGVIVAGNVGSAGEQREPERDAGQPAAGGGGETAAAGSGGSTAPLDAGMPIDECTGCNAAAQPLDGYCGFEHARCPMQLGSGRSRACDPALKTRGASYSSLVAQHDAVSNTCGGTSVIMRLTYGTVEYHYGADEKLRAVTTTTPTAGGPCNTTVYRYGDPGCVPVGDLQEIGCAG